MDSVVGREVLKFPDLETMSLAAAEEAAGLINLAIKEKGRCTLTLAGGSIPRRLYQLLADEYSSIPWSKVYLFWGDERYLPPDHKDSNFNMAYKTLISRVQIPEDNIYRIPTETETPEETALRYEEMLRGFFNLSLTEDKAFPVMDLILLGLGGDGHTASLFPKSPAIMEAKRWVVSTFAPPSYISPYRITLTLPVINNAAAIFFLVSGTGKDKVLKSILEDPKGAGRRFPAGMVKPRGRLVWFIDETALR